MKLTFSVAVLLSLVSLASVKVQWKWGEFDFQSRHPAMRILTKLATYTNVFKKTGHKSVNRRARDGYSRRKAEYEV